MILTDEEINAIGEGSQGTWQDDLQFARAIESAILAKLNSAEPVCYASENLEFTRFKKSPCYQKPLYAHPPASSAPESWKAIHLKTGNEYQVIGEAIDATNMHSNQLMVIYQRDGKTFVREAEEFQDKFKAARSE